jgi:hypothetical protein
MKGLLMYAGNYFCRAYKGRKFRACSGSSNLFYRNKKGCGGYLKPRSLEYPEAKSPKSLSA